MVRSSLQRIAHPGSFIVVVGLFGMACGGPTPSWSVRMRIRSEEDGGPWWSRFGKCEWKSGPRCIIECQSAAQPVQAAQPGQPVQPEPMIPGIPIEPEVGQWMWFLLHLTERL